MVGEIIPIEFLNRVRLSVVTLMPDSRVLFTGSIKTGFEDTSILEFGWFFSVAFVKLVRRKNIGKNGIKVKFNQ